MKKQIKYYLFFALIFLFGAFFAAGLYFSYGIQPPAAFSVPVKQGLSFSEYVLLTARFLEAELLMFLSGFTIYACAVAVLFSLWYGVLCGHCVMAYCLSELNPFTHAAALLFLLAYGALFAVFATHTSLYRSTLLTVAPNPKEILRLPHTLVFFYSFLTVTAVTVATSAAFYVFLLYFPL